MAPAGTVLFDRTRQNCYFVGPVLLTGTGVTASVIHYSTSSQWGVNIHLSNDDFLTKVAQPLVNRTVAFVVGNVVQSAPVLNPGITGRDVEITSNYSRADAIKVAASIMGIEPSQVHVEANRRSIHEAPNATARSAAGLDDSASPGSG